ncbi:hypothetical protein DY000_02059678 [Brassica cretica]|uniref:Uncharacterized protein n=1 Tax=Brassica cretica TaxID=69181 RepID=A0ABQ7AP22_BRACR|nr:hypothetical protein DY000_02059678 [Brassica cretica]
MIPSSWSKIQSGALLPSDNDQSILICIASMDDERVGFWDTSLAFLYPIGLAILVPQEKHYHELCFLCYKFHELIHSTDRNCETDFDHQSQKAVKAETMSYSLILIRQITTPAFVVRSPAVAEKSCIFGKIKPFIGETLDFITREEEKKEDLVDWAKRLNKRRQI